MPWIIMLQVQERHLLQTGNAAGPSAAGQDEEDGDEIVVAAELSLDEVLDRRRQDAIRNGQMLDLTAALDERQMAAAEEAIAREEAQAAALAKQQRKDAKVARFLRNKVALPVCLHPCLMALVSRTGRRSRYTARLLFTPVSMFRQKSCCDTRCSAVCHRMAFWQRVYAKPHTA
jgi:hypothetical protein